MDNEVNIARLWDFIWIQLLGEYNERNKENAFPAAYDGYDAVVGCLRKQKESVETEAVSGETGTYAVSIDVHIRAPAGPYCLRNGCRRCIVYSVVSVACGPPQVTREGISANDKKSNTERCWTFCGSIELNV